MKVAPAPSASQVVAEGNDQEATGDDATSAMQHGESPEARKDVDFFAVAAALGYVLTAALFLTSTNSMTVWVLSLLPWEAVEGSTTLSRNNEALALASPFYTLCMVAYLVVSIGFMDGDISKAVRMMQPSLLLVWFLTHLLPTVVLLSSLGAAAFLEYYVDWVFAFVTSMSLVYVMSWVKLKEYRSKPDVIARHAARVEAARAKGSPAPRSKALWRAAAEQAVPVWVCYLGVFAYYFCANPIADACNEQWQIFMVYAVSLLVIKIGGEKLLLNLASRYRRFPVSAFKLMMFGYEMQTSIMARMLLIGIPNPTIVLLSAIGTAVVECTGRAWLILKLRKRKEACRRELAAVTSVAEAEAHRQHALDIERREQILVFDLCTDMLVEYVAANMAMALLLCFGPQEAAFRFRVGSVLDVRLVASTLLAQHFPELVCDFICVYFEMRTGFDVKKCMGEILTNWRLLLMQVVFSTMTISSLLVSLRSWG